MRKRQKIAKDRKKALDAFSSTRPSRGKPPTKSASALFPFDLTKRIEYELTAPSPLLSFEAAESEKPKRGRPTVPDNFLLGSRNNWLRAFEENWDAVGFSMLEIRENGRGTTEDIRKVFRSLKGTDTDAFSKVFLPGTPQRVTAKEIRANRLSNSTLRRNIEGMRSRKEDLKRSNAEVEHALKEPGNQEDETLRTEIGQIKGRLQQVEEDLKRAEGELSQSDQQNRNQETYWYCSQLLDFLIGKRRTAVAPLNLANALAGLPQMGWRESDARCSKFDRSSPCVSLSYLVVELVSRMLRRAPKDPKNPPIEVFRSQILALPKKDNGFRALLCRAWRDFRLAIEECWKESKSNESMPYAITSTFLRNLGHSKTSAERILAEREVLS